MILILITTVTLALTMPRPEIGLYALVLFTLLDPICNLFAPSPGTS